MKSWCAPFELLSPFLCSSKLCWSRFTLQNFCGFVCLFLFLRVLQCTFLCSLLFGTRTLSKHLVLQGGLDNIKVKDTTFLPAASCLPFMEGKYLIVVGGLYVANCDHQLLDRRLYAQCSLLVIEKASFSQMEFKCSL